MHTCIQACRCVCISTTHTYIYWGDIYDISLPVGGAVGLSFSCRVQQWCCRRRRSRRVISSSSSKQNDWRWLYTYQHGQFIHHTHTHTHNTANAVYTHIDASLAHISASIQSIRPFGLAHIHHMACGRFRAYTHTHTYQITAATVDRDRITLVCVFALCSPWRAFFIPPSRTKLMMTTNEDEW